ncbi:MAG: ABC transporter substrate-binding protein [Prevotella sp.]|jgi:iron complex transport system substrate-binding protein
MKKLSIIVLLSIIAVAMISCSNGTKGNSETGDTIKMQYAQNITIVKFQNYTEVTLANPWKKGQKLISYALVDSSHIQAQIPEGLVKVTVPVQRSILFTAAHMELARMLNATKYVKGVGDAQYMHQPWLRQAMQQGSIKDCGNSMRPDMETMIALQPDAIFISPYENGNYGKLEHMGTPLIQLADYMETSALGRAEWMRFYGRLWGCEEKADQLFKDICNRYDSISHLAKQSKTKPQVIADRKTGSVWYMPGGHSTIAQLYRDADADYAFKDDDHSGSLSLSFETVLQKAGNADVWLLSFNNSISRQILLSEFNGYQQLKAFKNGRIYGCPVDKSRYFDEVPFRPDLLLRDMTIVFHPELNLGKPRYYQLIK